MKSLTFEKTVVTNFFFALMFLATTASAQSVMINQSNSKSVIIVNDGAASFKLSYDGDFVISEDDTKIESISDNGFFELSKKYKGKKRKVRIDAKGNQLSYEFTEGRNRELDKVEGMRWLSLVLPDIVKASNIGAGSKVKALYNKSGIDAVFTEINSIVEDHVKSDYLELLLEKNLSSEEIEKVFDFSNDAFKEQHYKYDFLDDHRQEILKLENGVDQYLSGVEKLKSSHYQSELIEDLIDEVDLNTSTIQKIFDLAYDFRSDHYFSEIAQDIAEQKGLTDEQVAVVINNSMNGTDSGHYKSEILDEILDNHDLGPKGMNALVSAVQSINSGHYASEVVDNIADSQKLSAQQATDLILSLESISSDHYLADALMDLADEATDHQGETLEAYKKVAKSMNSDHYYREVMDEIE